MKLTYRYVQNLNTKDKKKQAKEIEKSKKLYKKNIYYTRKKMSSFKSKPSRHVVKAKKMYQINSISPSENLAKKSGCSKVGLMKIVKKGQGAYYSSGSRPSQTAHSWGIARLASSLTGGKSSGVDFHILQMHCNKNSKALKIAQTPKQGLRKTKKIYV